MRLIDADALMELYDLGEELKNYEKLLSVPVPVIQQNIKDMPTIEVEPVVRCNECRFCKEHPTSDMVKLCTNEKWNTEYHPLVKDNGFCSY